MIHRLGVAVLLLLPTAAFAQGNPGPFGGLFGRTPQTGSDDTVFELRGSIGAQWDDGLLRDDTGTRDVYSDVLGSAVASAWFQRRSERLTIDARSTVEHRLTFEPRPLGGTSADNGLRVAVKPTTRVQFDANVGRQDTPFFQIHPSFVTLSSGIVVPGRPFVATAFASATTSGSAMLSYQYGKHSTVTLSAGRRETRFDDHPELDVTLDSYHGLWRRGLSRDLHLRLGYGRERWQPHAEAGVVHLQDSIEAGIDFNKALSMSRRTRITFSAATAAYQRRNEGRQYHLTGNVGLTRQLGRTWMAVASARRASEFRPGFSEVLLSDVAVFSVSGMLSKRIEWITSIGGGVSRVGFDEASGRFRTYDAGSVLNVALTRMLGVYTQASFYHYDIPTGVLPIAAVNRLSRRTVMVGLTAWVPVYSRERGIRGSR